LFSFCSYGNLTYIVSSNFFNKRPKITLNSPLIFGETTDIISISYESPNTIMVWGNQVYSNNAIIETWIVGFPNVLNEDPTLTKKGQQILAEVFPIKFVQIVDVKGKILAVSGWEKN
jgi:hypothetical protein